MGGSLSCLCSGPREDKPGLPEESQLKREVVNELPKKRNLQIPDSTIRRDKLSLSVHPLGSQYILKENIGKGSYGEVRMAYLRADRLEKRPFAVKIIEKNLHQKELKRFLREIEILKSLDHPNVVRFYEAYENKQQYFIVQEICTGGDFAKAFELQECGFLEKDARDFMWQILISINYLHQKGIAHRDIKPENFLLSNKVSNVLKLIDFGLSVTIGASTNEIFETVGSPFYIAPEVLERNYSPLCDIWSAGIILHYFMTQKFPFDSPTNEELFSKIKLCEWDTSLLDKSKYSPEAKNLLKNMLVRESDGRWTAEECLNHSWFSPKREELAEKGRKALTPEILDRLRTFRYSSMMQREMVSLLMQETDFQEAKIVPLIDAFNQMDRDFSGTLAPREIAQSFAQMNVPIDPKKIEEMVDNLYFKEKGAVTHLEFVAATLDKEFYQSKQRIRELFNYIDVDRSGEIDQKDLQDCYKRFGRLLDDRKIRRMIQDCDENDDGKIDFDEFYKIMVPSTSSK